MNQLVTMSWSLRLLINSMKIVLFDFDGVIADTFEIAYQVMTDLKYIDISKDQFRKYFNGNIHEVEDVAEDMPEKSLHDRSPFFEKYIPKILETVPYSGIGDVIKELSEQYKMVIVTSNINSAVEQYLNKNDLSQYFDGIYGADIEPSKAVKINNILTKFNLDKSDTVFITDTLGDVLEAKKAGVQSIAASWGYSKRKDLEKGEPMVIIDERDQIVDEVKKYLG